MNEKWAFCSDQERTFVSEMEGFRQSHHKITNFIASEQQPFQATNTMQRHLLLVASAIQNGYDGEGEE